MKNLNSKFSNKKISKWSTERLFNYLKEKSTTKIELDRRFNYLKDTAIEILKEEIIPKDMLNRYPNSKRIAIPLSLSINIDSVDLDKYQGISDSSVLIKNRLIAIIDLYHCLDLPEFRKLEDRGSFWGSKYNLDINNIKNIDLMNKLILNFNAYRQAYNNNHNFMKIDYGLDNIKGSYEFLNGYTWGKLYKFNIDWFNWLLDKEGISENNIYENPSDNKEDIELILNKLKLELEK